MATDRVNQTAEPVKPGGPVKYSISKGANVWPEWIDRLATWMDAKAFRIRKATAVHTLYSRHRVEKYLGQIAALDARGALKVDTHGATMDDAAKTFWEAVRLTFPSFAKEWTHATAPAALAPTPAHGCVCPAGAEATCHGYLCPRQGIRFE